MITTSILGFIAFIALIVGVFAGLGGETNIAAGAIIVFILMALLTKVFHKRRP